MLRFADLTRLPVVEKEWSFAVSDNVTTNIYYQNNFFHNDRQV
jgi:hypothetical protein